MFLLGCTHPRGDDFGLGSDSPPDEIATLRDGYHLPGLIAASGSLRLAATGTAVLVGGDFVQAGEVAGHPALWTQRWQAVPAFEASRVAAAADGTLYAASLGIICDLCNPPEVMRFANGTWTPLPDLPGSNVAALLAAPGRVVVGEAYEWGPNIFANDGTAWSTLGTADGTVAALAEHAGTICVGGDFAHVDGVAAASVACLANGTWTQAGDGLNGSVASLAFTSDGTLVAGGTFALAGGDNIATLRGGSWSALGTGTDARVNAVAIDGSAIVIGGTFQTPFRSLARFEAGAWSTLPGGLEARDAAPSVTDLAVATDGIYFVGHFDVAGGVAAANIARWSGTSVSALTSPGDAPRGINGEVRALLADSDDGDMIAAGQFLTAGTMLVNNVVRLSNDEWQAVGDPGEPINVLARSRAGDVYAAGDSGALLELSGMSWSNLGSLGGPVRAMTAFGLDLIIGGDFPGHVRYWNGSALVPIGNGLADPVRTLHVFSDGRLCAGVHVSVVGAAAVWCWDGSNWTPESSLSGTGQALDELSDGTEIAAGALAIQQAATTLAIHRSDWTALAIQAQGDGGTGLDSQLAPYGAGAFIANDDYALWWDGTQLAQVLPGRGAHALLATPGHLFVGRDVSWQSVSAPGPFAGGIAIYDLAH